MVMPCKLCKELMAWLVRAQAGGLPHLSEGSDQQGRGSQPEPGHCGQQPPAAAGRPQPRGTHVLHLCLICLGLPVGCKHALLWGVCVEGWLYAAEHGGTLRICTGLRGRRELAIEEVCAYRLPLRCCWAARAEA